MIGMGRALADSNPVACQVFQEADEVLGFPISKLAWEGPEEELNDTLNTQPALLTHSVAVLKVLYSSNPGLEPAFVAGHSMGELSALVASEALPFSDALRLVHRRGELMKRAGEINPGGMAAILGLDIPTLEKICASASTASEFVQVANDNCPGQVVISGSSPALERAVQLAREAGARHAKTLAVSIAAHSPLMANAQADFNQAVAEAPFIDPRYPLVGNVTATPLNTAAEIRSDLQGQLNSRVRWTESIQAMVSDGVTLFLELGSGSVLTGLLKRINREVNGVALGNPEDFEKFSVSF
jgi:[acyl-carrier-protein] S-malonyltransferase